MAKHKDEYLASLGHKNWKVGDSFIAEDDSHWVVVKAFHWSETDAACAVCFKGELAGDIRNLSCIKVK